MRALDWSGAPLSRTADCRILRFGFVIIILMGLLGACNAPPPPSAETEPEPPPITGAPPGEEVGEPVETAELPPVEPEVQALRFPWPPPRASAMAVIPAAFVRPSGVADPTWAAR